MIFFILIKYNICTRFQNYIFKIVFFIDKKVRNRKKKHNFFSNKTYADCFNTVIDRDVWISAFERTFKQLKNEKKKRSNSFSC